MHGGYFAALRKAPHSKQLLVENILDKSQNSDSTTRLPSTEAAGLAEILRIVKRRKLIIIASVLACVSFSLIYTSRQPKRYEAVARIDIDLNQPKNAINLDTSSQGDGATEQKLATQLGILQSQSLAWDVIRRLRLYENSDFVGKAVLTGSTDPERIEDVYRIAIIRRFLGSLAVQLERGTEIAQVRYRSTSPILAAQIANSIADAYIERNFQTRYATTLKASTWLNGQLDTLRKSVATSEQEFADFQRKTGLLQTDETHSTVLDKLTQLNVALSAAQTQRILKEVAYRAATASDPDQAVPATQLPALMALRTEKSTLESQYASLSPKYGDAYPRVAQLKSQIAQVQAAIDQQVTRSRRQIEIDYESAKENEDKLRAAVEAQKQQIFSMNENALQYSLLQRQVVTTRGLYEDLVTKLQEAGIASGLSADAISVIDHALAPNVPVEPRRTLNVQVGLLMGAFVGLALAFVLENFNATVRTAEDIRMCSGLATLGLIPHAPLTKRKKNIGADAEPEDIRLHGGLSVIDSPRSQFAEAFRAVRSSLLLSSAGAPPKIILICSAWPQEGKSTVSINLAAVFAQAGKRVLLVDGDLRRPSLHKRLGVSAGPIGLSGLLSGASSAEAFIRPNPQVSGLVFLPAGKIPPSSSELLMSQRMAELLEGWRSEYDFVVIDTAPILPVSDAVSLAAVADTVVVVVRSNVTRRQSLRALRDIVLGVNGKIAGALLNDVASSSDAYYGYYGGKGNYGEYYSQDDDAQS